MVISLASGCTTILATIANVPVRFADEQVHENIAYGESPWQILDVYRPQTSATPAPVIIFFYGGGWSAGSKSMYPFIAEILTRAGYVVVIPDYVKYPQARFPEFMHDAAETVAWVQQHINQYGGDPNRIGLFGHSAGAHIATLLVSDARYLEKAEADSTAIYAVAGLAGPYAFTPEARKYKEIFGPPENYPNMQVPTFIQGDEPPMLLLHGTDDALVYMSNLEKLESAIEKAQGIVEVKRYKGMGHYGIIAGFTPVRRNAELIQDVLQFFEKQMRVPARATGM